MFIYIWLLMISIGWSPGNAEKLDRGVFEEKVVMQKRKVRSKKHGLSLKKTVLFGLGLGSVLNASVIGAVPLAQQNVWGTTPMCPDFLVDVRKLPEIKIQQDHCEQIVCQQMLQQRKHYTLSCGAPIGLIDTWDTCRPLCGMSVDSSVFMLMREFFYTCRERVCGLFGFRTPKVACVEQTVDQMCVRKKMWLNGRMCVLFRNIWDSPQAHAAQACFNKNFCTTKAQKKCQEHEGRNAFLNWIAPLCDGTMCPERFIAPTDVDASTQMTRQCQEKHC